ncbi:TRAP-type C4-dicarboxylate transport system permease small subunit [Vreelandella songnenensis]|uniref:TRAP transporter small permease protein n=1 Tax=Vreelandella songnenensis TaxID=1176243 RepID=A0A2T0UQI7_9GAMM|nr:TRAP transporter small permease [Halomonas songnenensis]PRY60191.1 TRAP-type C4-dicarboxylate transport system permease small subunit [Halomonas songnenensis]
MRYAQRGYSLLLNGMALLAAIMLVWLMVAVVLSVVIRNLGLQPSAWFFLSTEYAMFYLTLLGAPWLVRQKGHVHIELLTAALPLPVLNVLSRAVSLLCVVVCGVLAWKGLDLLLLNLERNDYDVRAFFVPKWMLTVVFPLSFTLMAIEFGRFVVGRDILHSGEAGIKE